MFPEGLLKHIHTHILTHTFRRTHRRLPGTRYSEHQPHVPQKSLLSIYTSFLASKKLFKW